MYIVSTISDIGFRTATAPTITKNLSSNITMPLTSGSIRFNIPSTSYNGWNFTIGGTNRATISATTGAYSSVSDRNKKESIRKKDILEKDKDYLDRILKLNIYSYNFKDDE